MAESFLCGVTPLGVADPVFQQVAIMNGRVNELLTTSQELAGELATYQIANLSFSIDPTVVQTYSLRDVNIDIEFDDVVIDDVEDIPTFAQRTISTPELPDGEPVAPADAPALSLPAAPSAYLPSFGPAPTPLFPTVPEYGDLTNGIPFPELHAITLPPAPDVDFGIPFDATKPVFDATPPDASAFDYTEQAYDPLLVTEIKGAINAMLAGTTGLPKVVEDALFARAAERESMTAAAAVQEAFAEWSTRGHTLPGGPLQSKLMQTRQNNQNQANSLSREVMVRIHEVLVDQYKFGVAQGIALESVWVQLYNEIQNRRLQAAQVAVNIAISVYNALVSQYQAAAAVYKVEAEVYATRIQAELAKLQAYAEQLRAQQLIGQLNEQEVNIYRARLGAIETNVRVYLAEIQAYTATIEGERLKLDTYRTTIETETAKLQTSEQEIRIWLGHVQGQEAMQRAYQTRAQVYLGNVQAWRTKYEAHLDRQRGEIAALQAETQQYLARVQAITAKMTYQVQRGQAMIANNASKVQKYAAETQVASAYNSALGEKIRFINDANIQNTQLILKNGEINAANGLAAAQAEENALSQATTVIAQLASAMSSNVNMNAAVSDSTNFAQSCSYNTSQEVG